MLRLIVNNESFKKPSILEEAPVRYSNKSQPLTEKQRADALKKILEQASKLKW